MNRKLKLGVVGVGHLGSHHARIYSELARDAAAGVEFVGVYDSDAAKAHSAKDKFGCHVFSDLNEIAAAVDAVSVAVPTDRHYEVAKIFLEKGRHTLIEKPISQSVTEAEALVKLARAHGCIVQVGHVERFNPVIRFLEQAVQNPAFIEAHRLAPYQPRGTEVGVVLDLMIHDIEVILHLVKSPLKDVVAVGVPILSATEDIANARLTFANGAVANVTASRASVERMRKIRVFASDLYVSLDYQNQTGTLFRKVRRSGAAPTAERIGPTRGDLLKAAAQKLVGKPAGRMTVAQVGDVEIVRESLPLEKQEPLRLQLQSFIECARGRREPLVSGEKATEALKVAMNIVEQIKRNTPRETTR
jgi:predicted dehydrogenase